MTATHPAANGVCPAGKAWALSAPALAGWAGRRVFVRTDRFGGYYARDGETHKSARPNSGCAEPLSEAVVVRHFRATGSDHVIGAYPLTPGPGGTGRWVAVDLDNHEKDDATAERNERYAVRLVEKLGRLGFTPLAATWGTGGYHVWVFFAADVPGPDLYAFARWIVADAAEWGYENPPETYPKQPGVPAGAFGNWLRLFGRHHTRDAFASVFNGEEWVEGEAAVRFVLAIAGDAPDLIPDAARPAADENQIDDSPSPGPARGQPRRESPDVFKAFNATVTLDTVVGWHEAHGHRVTRRATGRVEFTRDGKQGKAQSFNVQVEDGVPLTWNFSCNAGLPAGRALTPAQVRCFYETGACDTATMKAFADVLRQELGWTVRTAAPTGKAPAADVPVHLTDTGNGLRFAADHTGAAAHVPAWGWVAWDSRRWARDDLGRVQELAKRTVRGMYAEAAGEVATVAKAMTAADEAERPRHEARHRDAVAKMKWALRSEDAKRVGAMLSMARSDPRLAVAPDRFDVDPFALNTPSGVVDLRTGQLRPHDPADLITRLAGVGYDSAARCPVWERFLEVVFAGDRELIAWVHRWCGYVLTGDVREHVVVIGWGAGGNGKTTFIETVMDTAAEYAHKANVELLLAGMGDRHATERAALVGKRLVAAAEAGDGRRLNESLLKECSGGDRITARFMFRDEFTFNSQFKLFLATNYRPEVRGVDEGVWRRLKLVPFTQRFWKAGETEGPSHLRADPDLRTKLKAELAGILAWCVRGAVAWYRDGLGTCRAVAEATQEYRQSENRIGQFVDERCRRDPAAEVASSKLFSAYVAWAESRKEKPMTQTRFGTAVAGLGFDKVKDKAGRILVSGLDLLTDF